MLCLPQLDIISPLFTSLGKQFRNNFVPSPGDLPDSGIEPRSPTLEADALTSEPPGKLI